MSKNIPYYVNNFNDYKVSLENIIRQYYPSIYKDFSDAAIGSLFVDLNAAIGDNLAFAINKKYNETILDFAQDEKSILNMARTFGVKIPNKRPSVTSCEFSVTVPTNGDTFDISYAPYIRRGIRVTGGGVSFESINDIDFSSPFTIGGIPNRIIEPNRASNGNITSYNIIKREIVVNGVTSIFTRTLSAEDITPFFELTLPEDNILSIESVIVLSGTNFSEPPNITEFYNNDNRWYQVDSLAQSNVFIKDGAPVNGIYNGKYINTDKRFIVEQTDLNFTKLVFGSGTNDFSVLNNINTPLKNNIVNLISNNSLGSTLPPNSTIFVLYRTGGGQNTNIGTNIVNQVVLSDIIVNGINPTINNRVINSLTVNNTVPALGGKDRPSIDEIRYMVKYNNSTLNGATQIKDYKLLLLKMPSEFGAPFKYSVNENQNKIIINTLSLDGNGNLSSNLNTVLNDNIKNYLAEYKSINDYILVKSGQVYNIALDIDLLLSKNGSTSQLIDLVIQRVQTFFDINRRDMGENLYIGQLIKDITDINNVLNVVDIKIYNKVGDSKYSMNETSQPYLVEEEKLIDLSSDYVLYGELNGMFEIKFPTTDIRVRFKEI